MKEQRLRVSRKYIQTEATKMFEDLVLDNQAEAGTFNPSDG